MGLDTSHGCWHGAYSAFHRWRCKIAELAGVPLPFMQTYWDFDDLSEYYLLKTPDTFKQYFDQFVPIKWEALKPDILHVLLCHSDCEGIIPAENCGPLANRLEELLPELDKISEAGGHIGSYGEKTRTFIKGLRHAAKRNENVEFR